MKRASLTSTVTLAALGVLVGCGGAPTGAGTADFCGARQSFLTMVSESRDAPVSDAYVARLHRGADTYDEVGTPPDIPAEARRGFEVEVETIRGLTVADLDVDHFDPTAGLSRAEKDQVDAFEAYVARTCR